MRQSDQQPELHFTEHGAGSPTLLLLHGVTRCGADWDPFLSELSSYRSLALDHRGHGNSGRAGSYLVNDYVADAVRFLREQLSEPVIVIGHSLGAMVAAAVAAEMLQQVRGIVLEDPPFHSMGSRIEGTAWQVQFIGMQKAARMGGSIEQIADHLAAIRLPQADGNYKRLGELRDRDSLLWSAACLSRLDPEVLIPIIEGRWLEGYEVTNILNRIGCPSLLLQADPGCGGAWTDADAELAAELITGCQHLRFPGFGHQLHRECRQSMGQAVREFITGL